MVTGAAGSFEERVGRALLDAGFVTAEQLEQGRQESQESGQGLLDTLMSLGIVARETLMTVLSSQLRIPVVDLKSFQEDSDVVALVPEDFARENNIRRPTPPGGPATGTGVAIAPSPGEPVDGFVGQDVSQLPAVQAVELVTLQAVMRNASDIHIVPTSDSSNVLFRLDGVLQEQAMIPLRLHESMVSRIKVLAEMDLSETRRPQDGSFTLAFGEKSVDFRVSTVGITWGEMMVIRILDRYGGVLTLEDVG